MTLILKCLQAINPSDLLGTHITGVISHGQDLFWTYLDINQYPHDSNLNINVLLRVLAKLSRLTQVIYSYTILISLNEF